MSFHFGIPHLPFSLIFSFEFGQHFGNRLDIDGLVHFLHGHGRRLHGLGHGLVGLHRLQFEGDALQVRAHFNEFGNVLTRADEVL